MRIKEKQDRLFFIVVRPDGLAYAGMKHGQFQWTHNWAEAKTLTKDHTGYVIRLHPGSELIKESDI